MHVPKEVNGILRTLRKSGFQAYLVGGCVRDILLKGIYPELVEGPKDWDIATNAKPEEIQKLFPDSVYENEFGTVGVKVKNAIDVLNDIDEKGGRLERAQRSNKCSDRTSTAPGIVEVTTFRKESAYTDKRHPDKIIFAKTIEDDLSRRDFTVNAMALGWGSASTSSSTKEKIVDGISTENETMVAFKDLQLVDPYNGQKDLKEKIIRAVHDPDERFNEDALRLMRAVRFAAELDFNIEEKTGIAMLKHSGLLEAIAKERIRDEFAKIIICDRAKDGLQMLEDYGLMRHVMPELREGIDCGQNKHHIYTVWEHNLRALDYSAQKNYSLAVRLASLLHDVGKPRSKRGEGPDSTFYGHDAIGAKMTLKIMDRLHFGKELTEKVAHLVRYHLFYYNVGEVTEAGVRRFLRRVGPENIDDLIKVREADRIGSGVPKAVPYKIRHLLFMIEKVKRDPISPKMLKIHGEEVMKIAELLPGPKVGAILAVLLEEVIEDPKRNTVGYLAERTADLAKLSEKELAALAEKAKETKEEFEAGVEEEIKKKHYVK
ncbi:MAG: CCA tRNA nucleotidyltransferase [Candidatus Liptonbacteria bacterium]|nr:CCA tRNA nucleotidyltransferase [Candidatus Liptonbacteria bacterium]